MANPLRATLLAAALLSQAAAAADAPATTLSASAEVPAAMDSCLDHSVKELGMSAKKVESERRWVIGPQYLHSAVAKDGAFGLRFDKGPSATVIKVTATWPGARKGADIQPELEMRMVAVVTKIVQLCGVAKAPITCTVQESGAAAAPCAAAP
jgi:hypothetical protein